MLDSALYDMKNYAGLEKGWGGEGKGVRIREPNPKISE